MLRRIVSPVRRCSHAASTETGAGESYAYKRIDLSNTEDKEFFEAAMAWDLKVNGKEWADGKNFK